MFQIDDKNIKRLERELSEFASKALPFATRKTLNDTAFAAQRIAKADVRNDLTLRNRFTEQSIQVQQERRELNIRKQQATVGSIADYMEDQEFGAVVGKPGKYGAVIPTSWAAGQEGQQPRTRLPKAANKLANIRLRKRLKRGKLASRRQEAFLRGLLAANEGDRYVFIPAGEGGTSSGIYRVWGRRRRKGRYTRIKLKMVYSMRRRPSVIPKKPWLAPAVAEASRMLPAFYADALRFQLRRHGLFKG